MARLPRELNIGRVVANDQASRLDLARPTGIHRGLLLAALGFVLLENLARLSLRSGGSMMGLLAQVIDIATPDVTQAVWRLETSWRFAPWLTVLAVLGFVMLVSYCYARERSPAGKGYRVLLAGLRMTTIALLLVMLSELLLAGTRSGRPRFAVLIDQSASMGVVEPSAELPPAITQHWRQTQQQRSGSSAAGPPTRLEIAQAALDPRTSNVLSQLAAEYELDVYGFADQLAVLGDQPERVAESAADSQRSPQQRWPSNRLAVLQVDSRATSTRLGDALEELLVQATGSPQGVLVVSDGRVTAGRSLQAAAESARCVATPLYFLGIWQPRRTRRFGTRRLARGRSRFCRRHRKLPCHAANRRQVGGLGACHATTRRRRTPSWQSKSCRWLLTLPSRQTSQCSFCIGLSRLGCFVM